MDSYGPLPQKPRSIRHDPRPYYDYIETGVKGHYHGFSYGKGIYVKHSETLKWVHPPSFRIQKNSDEGTLTIHILNEELKSTFNRCNKGYSTLSAKVRSELKADDVLSHWCDLSSKLAELKVDDKNPDLTKAFELLLEDCLLDSRLYEGTDIPLHYDSGKIPLAHRDAVQQRAVQQDIKDIDLAVDHSLNVDDFYIMAGYEPFVTPDDFPALPQSNVSAASSTVYAAPSSTTLEGTLPPREPIWNPLPSARSYQKLHFSPSDIFTYSVESRRNGATASSDSLNTCDLSIDDALFSTGQGLNWGSSDHCTTGSLLTGGATAQDGTCTPLSSICPRSSRQFGDRSHQQIHSAGASTFQYQDTQYSASSSDSPSKRIERPSIDDERMPRTWAQRLSHSILGNDSEIDFAPELATLRQLSNPGASYHSKLANKLKKRLKETYGTLAHVAALSNDRSGPSVFFRTISSPLDLYRAGSSVLKKVMANEPPHTLRQVMSCVILAECMLATSSGLTASDNAHLLQLRDESLERRSFLDDLSTWSSLLRTQQDIRSFDQIALALWDWTPPVSGGRATETDNNIEWKSVLALDLTQLISKTAHNIRVDDLDYGDIEALDAVGRRLDAIHHDQQLSAACIDDHERSSPGSAPDPPVWIDRFKDKYKERLKRGRRQLASVTMEELPAPQVVLLLSGAVFAAFCGFLIAWRLGLNGPGLSKLASRISGNLETEDNSIERNCVYVFLYVCLMWESLSGAPRLDDSNSSETLDQVAEELSKDLRRDHSHWWMDGLDLGYDKNSRTEDSSSTLSVPLSTTNSSGPPAANLFSQPHTESQRQSPPHARKRLRRSPTTTQRPKIHACRQHCGQNFTTIGNRNKHERKDCRKLGDRRARVQCQYCGKTVTRLHYAENGHLQRCREARAVQK